MLFKKTFGLGHFCPAAKIGLNILKGLNPCKVVVIDNLYDKFLKDDDDILARPISRLCNLPIKLNSSPRSCKTAKVKPFFKKDLKLILRTTALFHYPLLIIKNY